jgi:cellulose 1,4-beta-cellobiosidase
MKISTIFLRRSVATIIGMLALHSASSHAARCEYVIQNEWGGGFVAAVRITNDTATAIDGWSVSWSYTDGSTRTGGWNANISGSNPYTATGVGWNDRIAPGQTIEFGVMGNKSNGVPAERPTVTGAICGGSTSSEASSSVASSVVESSSSMDFGSSSSDPILSSSSSVESSSSLPDSSSESSSSEFSTSSESSTSQESSSSSLIASSAMSSSVSSSTSSEGPMDDHPLDNPFAGARWYVDPVWSAKARAEVGGEKVARFNTAVWMDRIGAIDPAEGFGLRDHLDAALEQGANLIQVVVYDLPNRDCHALASNGELDQGPEGTLRYRTEYIDVIAGIFADPRYSNLRIVAIIEPDSLPNLVTNLSDPDCQLATDPTDGYVANTRYTLNKLSQIPNVYSYVDIGHSGWLGWDDNFGKAITLIGDAIKSTDNGVRSIAGFVSNTAGYTPTHEPFLDALASSAFPGSGGGMQVRQASFYEWNPYFSEVSYVQAWRTRMIAAGFPESIGMLIDTSRNGWGGLDRPTAQSTSTVLDTFVNESRVDRRIHRGNWCNQPGGIGERPQATPAPGVDAYVWVKPPGESDGAASEELSFDPLDPAKGFDRMCDPTYTRSEGNNASVGSGALANAPVAGRWFPEAFQLLVQNAYPALDDVPASSSASSSSAPASSSSVVSSSEESSAESSSSVASSVEASSSVMFSSEPASSEASSSEASSSEASSSIESSSSELSSSSEASSSVSSSEQSSSVANQAPEANLTVVMSGSTVHVNGRASVDVEGDELTYQIDFGDGTRLQYPEAWHTYPASGSYTVTLTVSDGSSSTIATETVEAQAAEGNHAPVARVSVARTGLNIVAFGSSSFDADNDELSYLWDFGTGDMPGNNAHVFNDCESETSVALPRLVTLTVFDGELADTQQASFNQPCGIFEEITAVAEFTWRVEGNTVYVDASDSSDAVYLTWDFGDGGSAVGLSASHTYAEPGTYPVTLTAYGPTNPGVKTVEVTAGQTASSASTSSEGVSSSSVDSSSSSLSSSSSSSSSSVAAEPNSYVAPRVQTAPEIDGTIDAVWEQAAWAPINVFWLGTQPNPTADDYTGQYKALWDENYLYLLFDVTDERLYDHTRDPLSNYWEDDTVEIFIDENKNGGPHQSNTSAWAYHISSYGDVVDYTTSGPHLLNDHIDMRLVSMGDKHVWEMRVRIYGEDYADDQANTPLILTAGKEMGFSASYIDNDGNPQRESMMGSVDTPGHRNNQGYLDASVFGSLRLAE